MPLVGVPRFFFKYWALVCFMVLPLFVVTPNPRSLSSFHEEQTLWSSGSLVSRTLLLGPSLPAWLSWKLLTCLPAYGEVC